MHDFPRLLCEARAVSFLLRCSSTSGRLLQTTSDVSEISRVDFERGNTVARVWETWYIIHSNAARLWSELLVSTFPSSAVDSPPDVDFIYMAGGFRGRGEKLLLWFTLAMYHWALVKTKELFLCFLALNLSPPSLPSRPLPRSLFPNTRHKFGLVCDC